MACPVSPKSVPAFERLPASRRFQRKCGYVIAPRIEDSGSTLLQVLRVTRNQIEVRLERGRRKQGIDDGRRMTRFSFHTARNGPPATDDGFAERQYSSGETSLERISRRDVALNVGVVASEIGDALVVFGEREDTDEEAAFIDSAPPALDAGRSVWRDERRNNVGVDEPANHSAASRPRSRSRVKSRPST